MRANRPEDIAIFKVFVIADSLCMGYTDFFLNPDMSYKCL